MNVLKNQVTSLLLGALIWAVPGYAADAARAEAANIPAYTDLITRIESREGAYSAGLTEALLDLGTTLQNQGLHADAVTALRRGVHLTRINHGLHSPRQIPLLEGEIASHVANGNYGEADRRQGYLYRLQRRLFSEGKDYTAALMRQANWDREVYRRNPGPELGRRLQAMLDNYRAASRDIEAREGEFSPLLLPPLLGLLNTSYLIAEYLRNEKVQAQIEGVQRSSSTVQQMHWGGQPTQYRMHEANMRQSQNYRNGKVIIERLQEIARNSDPAQSSSLAPGEAQAMLGDWYLFHGERTKAWEVYAAALAELDTGSDSQKLRARLFADPVALPDLEGLRPLTTAPGDEGHILLEFSVNQSGKVFDVKRLDENPDLDSNARRLMRKLRKTLFRPRFEGDAPVEAIQVVRAFDFE